MSDLRHQIIHLAHSRKDLRPHLIPLLKGAAVKTAISKDTRNFIEWAKATQQPWDERVIQQFLTAVLGVEISPPATRRKGPRFQNGDRVEIKARKHKDTTTLAVYDEFNGKIGTVESVDGMDALVRFDSGPPAPVRMPNALKARGVGIYKYTAPYTIEGSAEIEFVYYAAKRPTEEAKQIVEHYMERSKPYEQRSENYYTGHVVFASTNKQGQLYFRVFPQQRMRVDPKSEAGFEARTVNPVKGDLLYIGRTGSRPRGWEQELEAIRAGAPSSLSIRLASVAKSTPLQGYVDGTQRGYAYGLYNPKTGVRHIEYTARTAKIGIDAAYEEARQGVHSLEQTWKRRPDLIMRRQEFVPKGLPGKLER